ncbi:MAG TPA: hypothetical protein VJW20_23220 [Candidatus Angelobacter sp.]|nr:hypothetical protein [Candidatus Angelobacter sp.]
MALKSIGQTTHFDVQYEEVLAPASVTVAQAVLNICENDLYKLNLYMPLEDRYRDPNPKILVKIVDQAVTQGVGPGFGEANNSGYTQGRQSVITINPFSSPGTALTPDFAGFAFVAEMAELLMIFLDWDAGSSQGEALSRVMAEELHPSSATNFVGQWTAFPSPKPDWISVNSPAADPGLIVVRGDQNQVAYGCGIVFIYFLRYQLGKSYQQICQIAGPLLLNRYQALTGLNDDPAARLESLLDKHFGPFGFNPVHNNIFPLLDGADRKLSLDFGKPASKLSLALHQPVSQGIAHIPPMFFCPAADYPYSEFGFVTTQTITASSIGIAQPAYEWRINGEPLFVEDGSTLRSVSSCNVDVPNPQDPSQPSQQKADFLFNYQVVPSPDKLSSSLTITTQSFGGDYHPVISVYVDELDAPTEPVSAQQTLTLSTLNLVYGGNYDADRNKCESAFQKEISHWVHIQDPLSALLGPKGDPPPGDLPGVVAAIDQIRSELARFAASNPGKATQVAKYAALKLGLQPHVLLNTAFATRG